MGAPSLGVQKEADQAGILDTFERVQNWNLELPVNGFYLMPRLHAITSLTVCGLAKMGGRVIAAPWDGQ